MLYTDLMQKPGKRINPKIYYFSNGEKIEYGYDDIISSKPFFNAKIVGTVMQGLNLEIKYELPDTEIYFENEVRYGQDSAIKTFGPYYLKEKPVYNADTKSFTITLYDRLLKTMIDYQPINIVFPTTVFEFFLKLCEECKLQTNIKQLPNGNRIISYDIYQNIGYTYRDVLEDIGQATGTLFKVVGNEISTCNLNSNDEVIINDDILSNQNIALGEHFGPINSIILSRAGDTDYIYKRDESLSEWNEFKISDNQLMNDNNRSEYLEELYDALYGIEYDIFDLELVGYGGFEPLQKIKIETGGQTYYSYVFNNEQEYTQGYSESIYTEMPEENEPNYLVSDTTDRKINQTYIIVNKQNQTIKSVVNQVRDQTEKITQVTQTVDELNQKISNIADLTIEGSSNTNILTLEKVFGGMPLNIKIYPIGKSISLLYPNINLYPNENLYIPIRYLYFENTETNEIFKYELPDDLLYLNSNVYDNFDLDYENEICQITKKCGYNADGTIYQLDQEIIRKFPMPDINITSGNYKIYLPSYDLAYIYCRTAGKNDYTNIFATKIELNSSIKQTSEEISLEVSKKISNDDGGVELASLIRQTAEEIYFKANNFGWESKNSSMTTDGDLTARNATLNNANIVGGKITLTDGAQIVGDDGLIVNLQFTGFTRSAYELGGGTYLPVGHLGTAAATANVDKLNDMIITYKIPENFIVQSARVILAHAPITWKIYSDGSTIKGYSRNLKLYKVNNSNVSYDLVDYDIQLNTNVSEISNAFGANGFTGNENNTTFATSTDIKNQLSTNSVGQLSIRTSEGISNNTNYIFSHTGGVFGYLEVIGYKKF